MCQKQIKKIKKVVDIKNLICYISYALWETAQMIFEN